MCGGPYLYPHGRVLVVSGCGVRFLFQSRGRLVYESEPRLATCGLSRVNGCVAVV